MPTKDIAAEVVGAARRRIDHPFRHHFKPVDGCQHGRSTQAQCMEVGIDSRGYDCSGLVIASICDALGQAVAHWSWDYRHLRQIEPLGRAGVARTIGDIIIFYPENNTETWTHMGIIASATSTIHADGINKLVAESLTNGISTNCKIVALADLLRRAHIGTRPNPNSQVQLEASG